MSDKKIIVKITDFGTICEIPSDMPLEERVKVGQSVKGWFYRTDKSEWFLTEIPVEIIDCRVTTKPQ